MKSYIGDGVYAEWDGDGVWLRCNGDHHNDDQIYLDPSVLLSLNEFVKKMRRVGAESYGRMETR